MPKVSITGITNKMGNQSAEISAREISRRAWLGRAIVLVGAGAVCSISTSAMAKTSQQAAKYQSEPKGELKCGTCAHFEAPNSCKLVDGNISENGWCQLYTPKPKT
jgi:hypothetical protein